MTFKHTDRRPLKNALAGSDALSYQFTVNAAGVVCHGVHLRRRSERYVLAGWWRSDCGEKTEFRRIERTLKLPADADACEASVRLTPAGFEISVPKRRGWA